MASLDMKRRFTLVLMLLLIFTVGLFSAYVYHQVRRTMIDGAERTLQSHVEHDARLHDHGHDAHGDEPGEADDIFLQLKIDGELAEDSFPKGDLLPKRRLEHRFQWERDGHKYEMYGIYDLAVVDAHMRSLARVLILGVLMVCLFVAPLIMLSSRVLLAPFTSLGAKAGQLNAKSLSYRFPAHRHQDEYGQLVTSFNALLERLQDSFGHVSRFATNASHEIRTPLSVIMSQAEMALRKADDGARRQALEKILTQAKRLRNVTNELLALAEAERTHKANDEGEVVVAEVVGEVVDSLLHAYASEQKSVSFEPVAEGLVVPMSGELLQSIVSNLLENALKYAKGRVGLRVTREGAKLAVIVEDDGPGIPLEKRGLVFEPFYKDAARANGSHESFGLGLAIVKACVDARHGEIKLCDSRWGGLSVEVSLPLRA